MGSGFWRARGERLGTRTQSRIVWDRVGSYVVGSELAYVLGTARVLGEDEEVWDRVGSCVDGLGSVRRRRTEVLVGDGWVGIARVLGVGGKVGGMYGTVRLMRLWTRLCGVRCVYREVTAVTAATGIVNRAMTGAGGVGETGVVG